MFFYIAKGLWFLLQPSALIALLIGYGAILIWTGWARWGRRFVTISAVLLLLAGLSPLGNSLILPLENRFPRADLDDPPPLEHDDRIGPPHRREPVRDHE